MSTWKQLLHDVAPVIATALGGPFAGAAAAAAGRVLLGDESATPEQLAVAMGAATPEQMAALKRADQQFTLDLMRLEQEGERDRLGDVADARHRETQVRDRVPGILAGLVVVGFFAVQAAIILLSLPDGAKELILRTLGTLDAALGMVLGYYYGSSHGRDRGQK